MDMYSFNVIVGNRIIGSHHVNSVRLLPAFLTFIPKVKKLYFDRLLFSGAYQVRDKFGRFSVNNRFSTYLLINNSYSSVSFICDNFDSLSGIGYCNGVVPLSWFSNINDISIHVYVSTTNGIITDVGEMILQKMPNFNLPNIGIVATVPSYPVISGNNINVPLVAYACNISLSSISISFYYDSSLLKFINLSNNSLFNEFVVLQYNTSLFIYYNISNNNGLSSNNIDCSISLGSLTFQVLNNVTTNVYSNTMNMTIIEIIDNNNVVIVNNINGIFHDLRNYGNFSNAQLNISRLMYIGLFPYTLQNELLDTGAITGDASVSSIVVIGITNDLTHVLSVDVTYASICGGIIPSNSPIIIQNCVVSVKLGCQYGSNMTLISVSYDDIDAATSIKTFLFYRVWCAKNMIIKVQDRILNKIIV